MWFTKGTIKYCCPNVGVLKNECMLSLLRWILGISFLHVHVPSQSRTMCQEWVVCEVGEGVMSDCMLLL